jgi:hypothetical protein
VHGAIDSTGRALRLPTWFRELADSIKTGFDAATPIADASVTANTVQP